MTVCSLIIVFKGLSRPAPALKSGGTEMQDFIEKVFPARHIFFVAVLVAYMFLLEPLGFIASSFLYLIVTSLLLGEKRYGHMIAVNVMTLAVLYLVFQTAFSVVLPEGFVERMFR
jgi:putative tricarboxylic transport membrane protein